MSIVSTSLRRDEPEVVGDITVYKGWYVQKGFARLRPYVARKAGHWPIRFNLSFADETNNRLLSICEAVDRGISEQERYVKTMLDHRGRGYW